eukprot:6194928-Pleurochrysis_carterae.AAC.4
MPASFLGTNLSIGSIGCTKTEPGFIGPLKNKSRSARILQAQIVANIGILRSYEPLMPRMRRARAGGCIAERGERFRRVVAYVKVMPRRWWEHHEQLGASSPELQSEFEA